MTSSRKLNPQTNGGVPEIAPGDLLPHYGNVTLVDVRRPDEYEGELSHIPGAKLATLGPELDAFLKSQSRDSEIVFVCRSGARSAQATAQGLGLGFSKSVNLRGGMLLWNELKYPVAKVN